MSDLSEIARSYHRRTKHRPGAYARGPEALDWSEQPDPFRRFDDSAQISLPLLDKGHPSPPFCDLFKPASITPAALNLDSIAALLELSLGFSAWKAYGPDRWALRCNPSSGNLHPTEGYVVTTGITELSDGVYHYRPDHHALEQRATLPLSGEPRLILGLSSILWREGWKYGERAFRYCQLDIGHAIAAFSYAAATLGWHLHLLDHHSNREVATLLGLSDAESFSDAEPEVAELLFEISPRKTTEAIPDHWFELAAQGQWQGCANRIDEHPYGKWPVVEEIASATIKVRRTAMREADPSAEIKPRHLNSNAIAAVSLIKQRRSAQHFDPRVMMPLQAFLQLLDATLPRNGMPPWSCRKA